MRNYRSLMTKDEHLLAIFISFIIIFYWQCAEKLSQMVQEQLSFSESKKKKIETLLNQA